MNPLTTSQTRLVAITYLAELFSPSPGIGCTGLMKLFYLVQHTRHQYLGYDFRLYTYGPHDPHVLEDIRIAELTGAIKLTPHDFEFSRGSLITAQARPHGSAAREKLSPAFAHAILDAVASFGNRSPADLETITMITFIQRNVSAKGETATIDGLSRRVQTIKPSLALPAIAHQMRELKRLNLLQSVA